MFFVSLLIVAVVNCIPCQAISIIPEQVHLAYGNTVQDIVVTWSTFNDTDESLVKYGIGNLTCTAKGNSTRFVDGGELHHTQYIHRVTLKDLTASSKYVYQCGSDQAWSPQFWFNTPPANNWQPSLAIYGDMGNDNAKSLERLKDDTQKEMYDAVLHVGDFAYDMYMYNGSVGDLFMNKIQPIAAHLPYMTCPGNHEVAYNFSHYRERFSMPGGTESIMYSFNMGPLHIISISTELYYYLQYGIKPLVLQYEWLEKDLIKANLEENREKQPWIIIMGHRPLYCSNLNGEECTKKENIIKNGLPLFRFFGLEDILYNYGVDLEIWAHEHSYERLWPIYNFTVYNGSYERPYVNPGAPVQITTGSAGCNEGQENFTVTRPDWSAFRSRDYGYTRLKAYNNSHLYLEQVSDDKNGDVIDSFWIVKEKHGPYKYSKIGRK